MSLEAGQITGTDISPNANILGTQIADKTLQFRNFSDDVFKVVAKVNGTTTPYTTPSCTGGQVLVNVASFSGPHTLGFAPAIVAYILETGQNFQAPRTSYAIAPDNIRSVHRTVQVYATSTQFVVEITTYIDCLGSPTALSASVAAVNFTLYALEESVTS